MVILFGLRALRSCPAPCKSKTHGQSLPRYPWYLDLPCVCKVWLWGLIYGKTDTNGEKSDDGNICTRAILSPSTYHAVRLPKPEFSDQLLRQQCLIGGREPVAQRWQRDKLRTGILGKSPQGRCSSGKRTMKVLYTRNWKPL